MPPAGIHDAFVKGLTALMVALKIGPGFDPATQCGPMITPRAVQKIDHLVSNAIALGARATTGGAPLEGDGYFYPPTVLENVDVNSAIAREEIFGPVAPVYKFETEEQAIELTNNTEYGLAAYVYAKALSSHVASDGHPRERRVEAERASETWKREMQDVIEVPGLSRRSEAILRQLDGLPRRIWGVDLSVLRMESARVGMGVWTGLGRAKEVVHIADLAQRVELSDKRDLQRGLVKGTELGCNPERGYYEDAAIRTTPHCHHAHRDDLLTNRNYFVKSARMIVGHSTIRCNDCRYNAMPNQTA